MMLLHLILRGVRQRGLVILNPYVIPRIDPTVARLASEKMISLADVSPVGAFAENRRAGLGSSIVMIAVISPHWPAPPEAQTTGISTASAKH
jgi:hypothetical protein